MIEVLDIEEYKKEERRVDFFISGRDGEGMNNKIVEECFSINKTAKSDYARFLSSINFLSMRNDWTFSDRVFVSSALTYIGHDDYDGNIEFIRKNISNIKDWARRNICSIAFYLEDKDKYNFLIDIIRKELEDNRVDAVIYMIKTDNL